MDASLASTPFGFLKRSPASSRFSDRAARALERIKHRCALTAQDRELVYRMRFSAYSRLKPITSYDDCRSLGEHYDNSFNHYNIMTFLDGEFVNTFRVHIDSGETAVLPSLTMFRDVLTPFLREGRLVIDLTRVAGKLEYVGNCPELPYLTIRAAWLAAEHFQADVMTSTCFSAQSAFYKRVFGFESLCAPRPDPQIGRVIDCMALDYRAEKARVEDRHPLFCSTEAERQSIFGPLGSLAADWRRPVFSN